jgi:hypothetical protein
MLAGGERDGDWRWQPALGTASVEHLAHSANVDGVALEDLDQRILERVGAIGIEQLQQTRGVAAEILAAVSQAAEERRAAGRRLGEAIQAAMLSGPLLFCCQTLQVLGDLELLAAIPAAGMDGDDVGLALDDADDFEVGEHGQGALRAVVWHRVVVEVEASVRCLADFDFDPLVCRKWLSWERKQAATLVVESITDGA